MKNSANVALMLAIATVLSLPLAQATLQSQTVRIVRNEYDDAWGFSGTYCAPIASTGRCEFTCGAFESLVVRASHERVFDGFDSYGHPIYREIWVSLEANCGGQSISCAGLSYCEASSGRDYTFDSGVGVCQIRSGIGGEAQCGAEGTIGPIHVACGKLTRVTHGTFVHAWALDACEAAVWGDPEIDWEYIERLEVVIVP